MTTKRCFLPQAGHKASRVECPVQVVVDGEQAITYLSGEGRFADRTTYPVPDIVFLDLKMSFVNGFGVLEWLMTQPELCHLRVFVLTGSLIEADRSHAMKLGATDFFIKPATPEMLRQALA